MTKLSERFKVNRQMQSDPDEEEYYYEDEELPEQYQQQPQPQPQTYHKRPIKHEYEEEIEEEEIDTSPLGIVNEIRKEPSERGLYKTIIGGVPVDLHVLEDYLVRTSPYGLKTVMRYHNARNMEEIKNYSRGPNLKMNSKTMILIILAILMLVLGLFVIFFLPKIMGTFQQGV